jgi:hypothetical protein
MIAQLAISIGCNSTPQPQGQASTRSENYPSLTARTKELEEAISRKDYTKMVDLTYPKLVDLLGGREKMLAEMSNQMKSMEAEGVELLSTVPSPPTQFVHESNGIYAVVPVTTKIKAKDGMFQTEGSLIAISNDGGTSWTFIDATGKDQTELKKLLPHLDKLNLPAEKPPVKMAS